MSESFLWTAVLIASVLRVAYLPISSHPFDFASYVFQAAQYYDFHLSPFFFWNKGAVMLLIFHVAFVASDFTALHFAQIDIVYLWQLFFKLPYAISDFLTAIILYQLLDSIDISFRRIAVILWLLSPWTIYVSSIHGQYAAFLVAVMLFSVLLLKKSRFFYSGTVLGISASIYYFTVLWVPIFAIYAIDSEDLRFAWRKAGTLISGFLIGLTLSFGPALLTSQGSNIISSLIAHSQPDAGDFVDEIKLPYYSLTRFPYLIMYGEIPSNISAPTYFAFASKGSLFSIGLAGLYALALIIMGLRRTRSLSSRRSFTHLMIELAIMTSIFMLFLAKLQSHYFMWILPLLLLIASLYRSRFLLFLYVAISLLLFVQTFTYQNLGLFFLNDLEWGRAGLWFPMSETGTSFLGFCATLCIGIFLVWLYIYQYGSRWRQTFQERESYAVLALVSCLLFYMVFFQLSSIVTYAYVGIQDQTYQPHLISAGGFFRFPTRFKTESSSEQLSNKVELANLAFPINTATRAASGEIYFESTSARRAYIYNVNNTKSSTYWAKDGALHMQIASFGDELQLSLGSRALSAYTQSENFRGKYYFADLKLSDKIPGGYQMTLGVRARNLDTGLVEVLQYMTFTATTTTQFSVSGIVGNQSYEWIEPYVTVHRKFGFESVSDIKIESLSLVFSDRDVDNEYVASVPKNAKYIQEQLIDVPVVSKNFQYEVAWPIPPTGYVNHHIELSDQCRGPIGSHKSETHVIETYPLDCFDYLAHVHASTTMHAVPRDFSGSPVLFLSHKPYIHANIFK
jgi:hypothetical protein